MNIDDIIYTHDKLEHELKIALSMMEKTDLVKEIRKEINDIPILCLGIIPKEYINICIKNNITITVK